MTFVINRWVRGKDFYGRQDLLEKLRANIGKPNWVLGNRRVGKTSILRQVTWLCKNGQWPNAAAMYWDLQGAGTIAGLKDSFLECLEDHPDMERELGMVVDELETMPFSQILARFRRKIKSADENKRYLLLIDECEELVDIAKQEPQVLSWFRKLGHSSDRFSIILAGSLRFMDLDESQSRTSPLMPDYLPPLPLYPLGIEQTRQLLENNGLESEDADRTHHLTFGNPHLVQVVGELFTRLKDWDAVIHEMRHNRVTQYFFQSNFQCLPETMRDWFRSGNAIENLLALQPGQPQLDYAMQASLLREGDEGKLEVNPLLRMEMGESTEVPEAAKKPVPKKKKASHWSHLAPIQQLLDRADPPLSTLPIAIFEKNDPSLLESAANPPSLEFMASLGESKSRMMEVLRGASPEYVLELSADGRTSTYLFGLILYHRCFGTFPFADEKEPWSLAGKIADCDVPIVVEVAKVPMPTKLAMILMRCLRANPQQRYADVDSVMKDLSDVIDLDSVALA